jgi:hypothetical protein
MAQFPMGDVSLLSVSGKGAVMGVWGAELNYSGMPQH